ncbi:MAG: peptidoglycan glycosyltransferase [Ruminococcus sp.]|nr:peptidoglycan glycosyltransferase [Ruminococcus sp.]
MLLSTASCSSTVERRTGENPAPTSEPTTAPSQEASPSASAEASTAPAEKTTEKTQSDTEKADIKGNIYDTKGRLLISDSDGKRVYADDYAISFANVATEMSAGYDKAFEDILLTPDGSGQFGNSITITLDANVQNAVYSYMQANNLRGACVAMRTDGSILAQVSYPSYDPRTVASTDYDEELAWGECGNKAFQNYEPGSCFKIMSEVISDKHGVYSLTDEGEWEFDGTSIVNWDHDTNFSYPMERSLSSAFINSSNIYFAKAFDQIGADAVLSDLDSIFHFVTDIECDFGALENNIEIYCQDDLRRTAFGQSYVLTSPLYLAALGREAVFGHMVRPFVLQNTVATGDPLNQLGNAPKGNEVIATIPQELRQNLLDGMKAIGSNLGVYVPEGYTLYAKTGTAETWLGDFLYITGCVKNNSDDGAGTYFGNYESYGENGSYIIVMMVQNPGEHGYDFASESAPLYQGLVNAIVGS